MGRHRMEDVLAIARKPRKSALLFLIAVPFIVYLFLFNYVPLFGWVYSLFNYKIGVPLAKTPFVGFKFYALIFEDSRDILRVLRNTFAFFFLGVIVSPVPVILALLMNEVRNLAFKKIVQTFTTLPYFISWVILFSLVFSIFSIDGVFNQIALRIGILQKPSNLLGTANAVWLFQTALTLWKGTGWNAIIYLAAIASIDVELYDAAKVDGAGRFRAMRHITVPGIMPTYIVLLLLSVGWSLSGFDQYFMFRNPVTADNIEVLDVYVYRMGILLNDYAYATALGVTKSLVSIVLLFSANFAARKIRGDSII